MAVPDHDDLAVAIVGMGALFPGAPDLDTFWANVAGGVDAISDAPADRLDPVFFDPSSDDPDRFYCRRGGFLGDLASFDPAPFGIMPLAVEGIEPDQLIALRVAAAALEDAGGESALVARERTGVIIGRGGYLTPGLSRLDQRVRTAQQLVQSVRDLVPGIADDRLAEVKAAFVAQLGPDRPESAIDLVPNLTASRIANRLDLHGPAFTVDGACASSLLAVDAGVRELRSGRCDLVVAGGVHLVHDVTLWSVFTQLGALSPAGQIRPFDRRADGLLIGEGAGMVVLKRLEDADRDGDRVYAIVSGIGISSDGREVSLMKPSTEGQLRSVERAWAESGLDPDSCGLIEAHGTATAAGDAAELATLARFFGTTPAMPSVAGYPDGGAAVVGSVKSMIGHAMPAAGAAGLIKAALSVHYGVAPPTLHCGEPAEGVHATRFRTTGDGRDWDVAPDFRVAAVDAFGFGGINTHAVLRAHPDAVRRQGSSGWAPVPRPVADPHPGGRVLLVAGHDAAGVVARLEALDVELDDHRLEVPTTADGPLRLAIVDPTPARLDLARRVVTGGKPWHGRNDVWFAPEGLITSGGGVAFLFPGVEPNQDPDVSDVAAHFGWELPERMGESDLERQSRDILWAGRILHAAMDRLGVRPDVMAGHSLGEWSGLIAAGRVPDAIVDELTNSLLPHRLEVPDVTYLMVGAGVATAQAAVEDLPGVHGVPRQLRPPVGALRRSQRPGRRRRAAAGRRRALSGPAHPVGVPLARLRRLPRAVPPDVRPHRVHPGRCAAVVGHLGGAVPGGRRGGPGPVAAPPGGTGALPGAGRGTLRAGGGPVLRADGLRQRQGVRRRHPPRPDGGHGDRRLAEARRPGPAAAGGRRPVGRGGGGRLLRAGPCRQRAVPDARQPLRLGTPMVHLSDGPELAVSSRRLRRGCSPAWIPTSCWAGRTARWWWRTSR